MSVAERYRQVLDQVAEAALRAGRRPEEIAVVAVSKGIDDERIREAVAAGVHILGENRVQEARDKHGRLVDLPVSWHLVGHLQTNKVKYAVKLFDLIHSLDSVRLAREIQKRAGEQGRVVRVLVEVNVSGEPSKYGVSEAELRPLLEEVATLPLVRVEGLMTIAPLVEHMEQARPCFRRLRELARRVREWGIPGIEMKELSMGMTQDFPVAVEEGATMIRVGTAIFGPRG
ncbi:MAG: YggS family pyridoxal phosphate-dependent enzyme [Bacillota bacterium]